MQKRSISIANRDEYDNKTGSKRDKTMNEGDLVGISGKELMAIRKHAGWSRPRMERKMREQMDYEGDLCTVASILRYEGMEEVPLVFAKRYRDLIGHDAFDRLLEEQRAGNHTVTRTNRRKRE
jgi:hypothetical protein